MTREEVKHIVDVAFDVPLAVRRNGGDRTYLEDEIREAKNMAVKALEQETCDDAISRQAVLDAIHEADMNAYDERSLIRNLKQRVNELPPVNPQTKTGHWIPVKFRPLTDEERKEYPDYCFMADCLMPDDGEEILVSTKYGRVEKDECGFDDGYYLDSGYDWQTDIGAWMPLPKPYELQESEDKE